jgi:predicted ATPase/uncharacterized protein HemY
VPQLPSGTVTFLFTDIEGSTRLLNELGDNYAEALAEHRRKLRGIFDCHGGVEVDTQGDAFFVVFARAGEAVTAASEAQSALAEGPFRVRMGLHTGEPLVTDEGYVGIDVHRAARIAAAGHGGQVLLSQATSDLVDSRKLCDLGDHRLKDLTRPERIYQLGSADFPPLKSLNQTNLPVQPMPLVGRQRELSDLVALLSSSQIVTVTGAGGSGKTRLSLQVAAELVEEFTDGVWFVPLASLRDPRLVLPTMAQVVGLGSAEPREQVLRERETLLLLDNFEQLLEAAPMLAELLQGTTSLKLLVTSRAPLRISAEHEYPLEPLLNTEAIDLFAARARAVRPTFEPDAHVAEICSRLDNLPLAIELAAARARVLTSEMLVDRLEQRLPLLIGGPRDAPERQRTLQATIEWSYELLCDSEKRAFAQLAVFAGGFELTSAEAIAEADLETLEGLVSHSLARRTDTGRFFMLQTIREFAMGLLPESDANALRRRHADYFLAQAERAEGLVMAWETETTAALERERDNLRTAWTTFAGSGEWVLALRLAAALGTFWSLRGPPSEGLDQLERSLAGAGEEAPEIIDRALSAAGMLAFHCGDLERARTLQETAVKRLREVGDDARLAHALRRLGTVLVQERAFTEAQEVYAESLAAAQRAGSDFSQATSIHNLGVLAIAVGDYQCARRRLEQALEMHEKANRPGLMANSLCDLGLLALAERRFEDAGELMSASAQRLSHNLNTTAYAALGLAAVASAKNNVEQSVQLAAIADRLVDQLGARERYAFEICGPAIRAARAQCSESELAAAVDEARSLTLAEIASKLVTTN